MLRPEEEVDTTEIDAMLEQMDADCGDKVSQVLKAIAKVNGSLKINIKALETPSVADENAVSREELLNLLRGFAKYSKALEHYIKEHQLSLH